MAKVVTNVAEQVFAIKNFLGVNEAKDGEARLKYGEAAEMRNFCITDGGALVKRPGSKNVTVMAGTYHPTPDTGHEKILLTELGITTATKQMYPRVDIDSDGVISLDGEAETVSFANESTHIGWYYEEDDVIYRFSGITDTPRTPAAAINKDLDYWQDYILYFDSVTYTGGTPAFAYTNPVIGHAEYVDTHDVTKYTLHIPTKQSGFPTISYPGHAPTIDDFTDVLADADGDIMAFTAEAKSESYEDPDGTQWGYDWSEYRGTQYHEAKWEWKFDPVIAEPGSTDPVPVRSLWSGYVGGDEVICAACDGTLWELTLTDGEWSKESCGLIDTSADVFMFGFDDKLYLLNGTQYKVWDGLALSDVATNAYVPLVEISTPPAGGGTTYEQINKLSPSRRVWFSPDEDATTTYQLPETNIASVDYVKNLATNTTYVVVTDYTVDLTNGTIEFDTAPAQGVNTIEIKYSMPSSGTPATPADEQKAKVLGMKYAELYNGAQDTRVFLYGDGSNEAIYSGLDTNGRPRADYFPDMNICAVGEKNTPITAMLRHYNRLLCFKLDSTYSIGYDTITLADGTVAPGFYISTVNRDIGNVPYGQATLVNNRPRTFDGRSVIEWKATSNSGNITGDQRNADVISQRIDRTMREIDLTGVKAWYDKVNHEYYVIAHDGDGKSLVLVQNTDIDAWYIYTDMPASCIINYKDEIYYGTEDGWLRHFSFDYYSDNDEAIDAYWRSGAMDFKADYKRKYSAMIWVGIKPEEHASIEVSAVTDRKDSFTVYEVTRETTKTVPSMTRLRLKAKKFAYYEMVLQTDTADTTATVVSVDIRVRDTGYVR